MQTSAAIGAIAAALAKAQKIIKAASFDRTNPHFKNKYATLPSIMEAIRGPLADNGIAILQGAEAEGAVVKVTTRLAHSSGEWIESCLAMTAQQNTPQGVMAALTYCRRGSLSLVCVVSDDDDDGEQASAPPRPPPRQEAPKTSRPAPSLNDRKTTIALDLKALGYEPAGIPLFVKGHLGHDKATTEEDVAKLEAAVALLKAQKASDKDNDLQY
jgi:hypothetical protein